MRNFVVNERPPASPQAVAPAEAELGQSLPSALRELLTHTNGAGTPANMGLRIPDGTTAGAIDLLPVEKIAPTTIQMLGRGSGLVVWAEDSGGNALTIDEAGYVYFWDHDTDEDVPFRCKLDQLPEHFYEVVETKAPPKETTASPLRRLIEGGAGMEEIGAFLEDALTTETAESFLLESIRSRRGDVLKRSLSIRALPPATLIEPLYAASRAGMPDAIEDLVRAGADVDARRNPRANTCLMGAALGDHLEAAKTLIRLGADPTLEIEGATRASPTDCAPSSDLSAY